MSQADIPLNDHNLNSPSTDDALQSSALSEAAELVDLMQDLQRHNAFLLERVAQLEASLDDCQSRLQTQNLTVFQEHIARLTVELESSHQIAQRQQHLIETITGHLHQSQEEVSTLKLECSTLRQQQQAQGDLLEQSEKNCDDLKSRLDRQQRFTLQLKAALERCLEKLDSRPAKFPPDSPAVAEAQVADAGSVQPWLFDETAFSQDQAVETLLQSSETLLQSSAESDGEVVEADFPPPEQESPLSPLPLFPSEINYSVFNALFQSMPREENDEPLPSTPLEPGGIPLGNGDPGWPSPVVYPARSSQKKLSSLAAVSLPSFPPLGQI
ncbi:hypothetical protein BST81_05865 [Leptolyngbya sp. 'hensonii']|uniref:hypothetical protein n=1 Tax=Leptolyngbya sp. 'hensonii' TaxID=1922337 RepID=UPI00094F7934|nr:hypothetical protein [Leptolyngbya sp. 'hensonii']OLP19283.1 hypothetical protein BST81_05865 [Leptolyngbya sp. 'hensonii']